MEQIRNHMKKKGTIQKHSTIKKRINFNLLSIEEQKLLLLCHLTRKKKQPKFLKFILQKRKENENSLFGYSRKIKEKALLIGYKYSNSEIWRL